MRRVEFTCGVALLVAFTLGCETEQIEDAQGAGGGGDTPPVAGALGEGGGLTGGTPGAGGEIGLGGVTGSSGVRLRVQVDTYDWDSFRPMAGVIFHF